MNIEGNKYKYYGGEVENNLEGLSKTGLVALIADMEEKLKTENEELIKIKMEKEKLESQGVTEENDEKGDWFMVNDVEKRISSTVDEIENKIRDLESQYLVKVREDKIGSVGDGEQTA